MFKLSIPRGDGKILFEAILEPTESAVKKLKSKDMGEGEITTFRNKTNKVVVGMPDSENLISRFVEEKREIPREIRRMTDDYDFHLVSLSCSFRPDPDCRFVWARFGVELNAWSDPGELHEERPIAYDMFPDEVLSEIKHVKEIKIDPELKFNIFTVQIGSKLFDITTKKELIVYEPQIFAYGIKTSSVSWDFESTEEKGIWGNKRNLFLIVKAPKNSRIKGRFLLGADVEFDIMKGVPIHLSKRIDDLVNKEYDLLTR